MASSVLDQARDELFSHINRCGVLHASPEDQSTWMSETVDYLAERYPDLGDAQLDELIAIGKRFCAPAINHGAAESAAPQEEIEETAEIEETVDSQESASVA